MTLVAAAPGPVTAQTTLEDVVLRGRILAPDGSPLADTPVVVDAVNDDGFAIVAFFFSLGTSTLACLDTPSEPWPFPNSERFTGVTDGEGRYEFVFPEAHAPGVETDTDCILQVAVPVEGADFGPRASYELELVDAVHDAPDLRLWDPALTVTVDDGDLNATSGRTIYHQRFTGKPVDVQGELVPASRGAACTAARLDGSVVESGCGFTDGDLVTPAVPDETPCRYWADGTPMQLVDVSTGEPVPCQPPVEQVVIDLGVPVAVGQARPPPGEMYELSPDGVTWQRAPAGAGPREGTVAQYVRLTGHDLGLRPELSVWPPTPPPAAVAPTTTQAPAAPTAAAPDASRPPGTTDDRDDVPAALAALAAALAAITGGAAWRLRRPAGRSPG